jgi:hypothetical protein
MRSSAYTGRAAARKSATRNGKSIDETLSQSSRAVKGTKSRDHGAVASIIGARHRGWFAAAPDENDSMEIKVH